MAQGLRALTVLGEDLVWFPAPTGGSQQLTPVQEDPPSDSTGTKHMQWCTHMQAKHLCL